MRGTVTKKRDRWYICYYVGKDAKGKWKQKWEGSWDTKKAAEKVLRQRISELEETFYYASDAEDRLNMTYEEMHDLMKKALVLWGKYTGCKLGGEDSREL